MLFIEHAELTSRRARRDDSDDKMTSSSNLKLGREADRINNSKRYEEDLQAISLLIMKPDQGILPLIFQSEVKGSK